MAFCLKHKISDRAEARRHRPRVYPDLGLHLLGGHEFRVPMMPRDEGVACELKSVTRLRL
jgi:hypothetical protein